MESKKKENIYPLKKQLKLLDCQFNLLVNIAIRSRLNALKHHQEDIVELINKTWKNFYLLVLLLKKFPKIQKITLSMLGSLPKNNWMTFLDKLNTFKKEELNMLHIPLLQILLQELTLKEKAFKPFWTPAYKDLSERLLSPIEIGYPDSDSTFSNLLSKKQEETSSFLMMKKINLQNKNSLKTYYQLSTSTVANKWEKENIKLKSTLKALKIKLRTTKQQRTILDEWIDTSRYVYNKTIECINNKHPINFNSLRDKLVTKDTKKNNKEYKDYTIELDRLNSEKKDLKKQIQLNKKNIEKYNETVIQLGKQEQLIMDKKKSRISMAKQLSYQKNEDINDWECNTHKDVRSGAIQDICDAYKVAFTNLRDGNIKYFKMKYKKKTEPSKCIRLAKNMVKNKNGIIEISPEYFKESKNFQMGKKTIKKYKDLKIEHDTRIIKQKGEYWLIVPIPIEKSSTNSSVDNYCGIDPGVRTFMTTFGNNNCMEYKEDKNKSSKINNKRTLLLDKLHNVIKSKRVYKKKLNKLEIRKENLLNEMHWKVINDVLNRNDVIFYGNIKSHDIVKNNKNRNLNRNTNDLKFFKFKERFLFKAYEKNKKIFLVNEAFTTQTCSCCGFHYKHGSSKIYECKACKKVMDRDINASKNILMKGIMNL